MQDSEERKWWTLPAERAAAAISGVLSTMKSQQVMRRRQLVKSARLYGNTSVLGPGAETGRIRSSWSDIAVGSMARLNVIQSCVDTVTSRVAKNRPEPFFLTSGGDWRTQRRARAMNRFCRGVFNETRTHELAPDVFRDAAIFGDGFLHVYIGAAGRVVHERVPPDEIWVDELEGYYGEPRQMHRVRRCDRDMLTEMFPDSEKTLKDCVQAVVEPTYTGLKTSDLVEVRESWHLPSGPEAQDGVHVVTVADGALTAMEPWEHGFFPFARMRWAPRPWGWWSQGLAEQLAGAQIEHNRMSWTIQRGLMMGGKYAILVENGSKVDDGHFDDRIGTIIKYSGTKPDYVLPPVIAPEMYAHRGTLKNEMYEQCGVSQLAAASQKPAGLYSGAALREYNDIGSERLMTLGQRWEAMHVEIARLDIAAVRDLMEGADGAGYSVSLPGEMKDLKWSEVELPDEGLAIRVFPVSSLPQTPEGRIQTVQEWVAAGWLSPQQARRLQGFPDIEREDMLLEAARDCVDKALDGIVDDGEMDPPQPYDDLAYAGRRARETYAWGRASGLDGARMELLRRYMAQADALAARAAQAAMPAAGMAAPAAAMPQQMPRQMKPPAGAPQGAAPMPAAA